MNRVIGYQAKSSKSQIWQFFAKGVPPEGATCKSCNKPFEKVKNTTNLWNHLNSQHPQLNPNFRDVEARRSENVPKVPIRNSSSTPSSSNDGNSATVSSTGSRKRKLDVKVIEKYDNAVAKFIAIDMMEYEVVQGVGFQDMLKTFAPDYDIPHRTTFSNDRIPKIYNEQKSQAISLIKDKHLSLTTDCWSSLTQEPYISVTVHFINKKWEMNSLVLECRKLDVSHTGENLKEALYETLEDWGISKENIIGCTTDNGSNVVKAVKLAGWGRIPCFGHTLNIAVSNIWKNPIFISIIKKSKKFQNVLAHSWDFRKKLAEIQDRLKLPVKTLSSVCDTRWWSLFHLLETVAESHPALVVLFSESKKKKHREFDFLSQGEIQILKELIKSLKTLETLSQSLCGENYVTASSIWPVVKALETAEFWGIDPKKDDKNSSASVLTMNENYELSEDESTDEDESNDKNSDREKNESLVDSSEIPSIVKDTINSVMEEYYRNPATKILLQKITFLDPRFKNSYTENPEIVDLLKKEACNINLPAPSDESKDKEVKEKKSVLGKILSKSLTTATVNSKSVIQTVDDEMNFYLACSLYPIEENPLNWWRANECNIPRLACLAKRYLSIPGSSVPSERVFSAAGNIVTDRRVCLSDIHVNQLVFLSKNHGKI